MKKSNTYSITTKLTPKNLLLNKTICVKILENSMKKYNQVLTNSNLREEAEVR